MDPLSASESLMRLVNLHVIESRGDGFLISPPLRIGAEKDRRFELGKSKHTAALHSLAKSLSIRLEEGTAPIALVDSAVLSAIEAGDELPAVASAFLLPSHYVWLAEKSYDKAKYDEAIHLSRKALKSIGRLSGGGIMGAGRYLCLAASRLGDNEIFGEGILVLQAHAKDASGHSNIAYLRGFNLRLKGRLPEAEAQFREAYKLSPGNKSAGRDLAAVCLARGNLEDAEYFAREAWARAPGNPWLLDILIAVLIKRYGASPKHAAEVRELFDALEKVGEEDGRSFFTTRRAEYEHLCGNNKVALALIEQASEKTGWIFETQRLYAEILLKEGRKSKAKEVVDRMRDMVNAKDPRERRTNYRGYLETYAHYLQEVGNFDDAKDQYGDSSMFTEEEKLAAIRDIEIAQEYTRHK